MNKYFIKTTFLILLILPVVSSGQVSINEAMYDPQGTDSEAGGEWIELKILDTVSDLSSWKISDKTGDSGFTNRTITHISGPVSLSAGSFVVIAKDPDAFNSFFSSYSGPLFKSPFSLTDDDEIKIINPSSANIDSFSYSDSLGAKGDGNSLQKSGSNWVAASPTPGAENSSSNSDQSNKTGEVLGDAISDADTSTKSATSGSAIPSYGTASSQLEVSAGGDRLTSSGSPISFQAVIKKNTNSNSSVNFSWSFGDGTVGKGALVSHTYKYPGDYALILNARSGNTFAIARVKVKVLAPELSISHSKRGEEGYIEIFNNSNYEINLFNWKLVSNGKGFIFQPDTIVLPKSSIKFDKNLLNMKGQSDGKTVLKDMLGREVTSVPDIMEEKDLLEASSKLNDAQKETIALLDKAIKLKLVTEISPEPTKILAPEEVRGEVMGESVDYQEMLKEDVPEAPLGQVLYESPVKESLFKRVIGFFGGLFR